MDTGMLSKHTSSTEENKEVWKYQREDKCKVESN